MGQGASLRTIAEFVEPGSRQLLQDLLATAMDTPASGDLSGLYPGLGDAGA
jgi:hypothetical protein